jgi:DNA-binding transcriptional MerR regulator
MEDTTATPCAPRGLLTIGQFSRQTGLSIGALRHYDTVGLLRPAAVDTGSSYRRYGSDQIDAARTIAVLRDLEVPLDEIREVLGADDPVERRAFLVRHRARTHARVTRLHTILHHLTHLIDPHAAPEEYLMSITPAADDLDTATQLSQAKRLFNRVWELLEASDRTPADDDEMVNSAHASRLFWTSIGTPKNLAIGDWQISRVYSTLNRAEPAVHHARLCLAHAQEAPEETWLLASAYEGLARAYAVAGDRAVAAEWKAKAEAQLDLVDDPDDREVVVQDIATLPL